MTAGALSCVAAAVALLLGAFCACHGAPENACDVGGALVVLSTPACLPVSAICCDMVFNKEDFQLEPTVKYLAARSWDTYTLFMLDADGPGLPEGVYVIQWLLANIPGEDFKTGNRSNSTEIVPYMGPFPLPGTGLHRYMFFVYRHWPPSFRIADPLVQLERFYFDLEAYLKTIAELSMELRGPLAGVQFRSGFNSTLE